MIRFFIISATVATFAVPAWGQLTWKQCQDMARKNYPLIKQYRLVEQSTEYTVSNAAKAWLPQVSISAQATYQNDVAAFPDEMKALYNQIGIDMKGLNKDQYRATLEINQTIWDGGLTKAQQDIARSGGKLSLQNLEVELYALRERVSQLYFGVLTLRTQLQQNALLQELLQSNLQTLNAGAINGIVTEADRQTVQVELLSVAQQRIQMESAEAAFRKMLSVMIGKSIEETEPLEKPVFHTPSVASQRPEILLFESQKQHYEAQKQTIRAANMPRIGLFAQGFYGNPGLNLFKDMTENRWKWNYMAGIRFQWNFGSLYTQKGNLLKLSIAQQQTDNRKDIFLYNQTLKITQQQDAINGMRRMMAGDDDIIALRTAIRKASEAKLANGTLTAADLLRDVNAENQALRTKALHEIEWLKNLCDLIYTTNSEP